MIVLVPTLAGSAGGCSVFEVPQEVALKQLLVFFTGLATLRTLESPPCQDHGSRHPYARIAAEYAVAPGHSRPKLLGLTASPGETLEQTRRLLKQLQATSLNSVWNWLKNWLLEVPASFFFSSFMIQGAIVDHVENGIASSCNQLPVYTISKDRALFLLK